MVNQLMQLAHKNRPQGTFIKQKIYDYKSKIINALTYSRVHKKHSNFTMIRKPNYIANLELVHQYNNIQGSVVECGTWKGGMIAGIAQLLGSDKRYYLYDSFEGLPKAEEIDGKSAIAWQANTKGKAYYDNCSADISYAQEAMQKTGLKNYAIKKGWFEDTLPLFDTDEKIAILRIDADWYQSTMTILDNLFDNVVVGGLIIIDDYFTWDGCSKAVHDFLSKHQRPERINKYKNICYIKKLQK
jgi:O-methyltransferase